MSIATYSELKIAIGNWTHRDNLTQYYDDLIMAGEKWIFRKARTRDMETALSVSITAGLATIPTDYVALKYAYIDGSPIQEVVMRPANWIYSQYPNRSGSDKPCFIATEGSNFIFGPYGGSAYTVKGTYYKRLTAVSSSVNALFTANPDLYLYAALAETYAFLINDKRIPLWTAKRDEILAQVNGEDVQSRSGDAMTVMLG